MNKHKYSRSLYCILDTLAFEIVSSLPKTTESVYVYITALSALTALTQSFYAYHL